MANEAVAQILREMAFLSELKGENPFKIRALENSARLLEDQSEEATELVRTGAIGKISGVGKGTQAIVKEWVEHGHVKEHDELRSAFPSTIFEDMQVSGLGPKKAKSLYEQLGIASLAELEYACQENRLLDLKGFGEKTQNNILKGIALIKSHKGKAILPVALQEADAWQERLSAIAERVEPTGELRRHMEVISSLDFLVQGKKNALEPTLAEWGFHKEKEQKNAWVKTAENGLLVRALLADKKHFGSAWLQSTGPEAFVKHFPFSAAEEAAEEAALFAKHKLPLIPAECRDLAAVDKKTFDQTHLDHLIEEKQIKGVFHLHTRWSDGADTLEAMVAAAHQRGWEYLGVSEHSQSAFYANGLNEKRVLEQKKEIERIQKKYPVRIFHGIESDILADGSLDYSASFLKNFDFVIASVHGQMRSPPEEMTKRICHALENPATTWLGHWTGRLLLGRDGYGFDHEKVIRLAAKLGKGIELNASPYRLDMDWRILPEAAKQGVSIGIFPDAHSVGGLGDVTYGVWMARKAGLTTKQVANTMSAQEMAAWLQERRA